MYKLFLDDERDPIGEGWSIVRSSREAIAFVNEHGLPSFISFDHDLGGEDTAMPFVHWLVDYCIDNNIKPDFDYYVHSQNPIGAANIESLISGFKYCFEN